MDAFAAARSELRSIETPFGTIYWRPASMREVMRIMPKYQESEYAGALENVLVRSLKEDGTRLFADAARFELERDYPPELLGLIAGQMPLTEAPIEKHP